MCVCVDMQVVGGLLSMSWWSGPGSNCSDHPPSQWDCFFKVIDKEASLVRYQLKRDIGKGKE